jgi:hypothetical protein
MAEHVFRNPDKVQQQPFRDWIRKELPPAREGAVVLDIDLLMRVFGTAHGTDAMGRLAFFELKHGKSVPTGGQKRTYALLDELLRTADPRSLRYAGMHLIQYSEENWSQDTAFSVNGCDVPWDILKRILLLDPSVLKGLPKYEWLPKAPGNSTPSDQCLLRSIREVDDGNQKRQGELFHH